MGALRNSVAKNIMQRHPCFDEQAHERVGRMHLAVAPRCNIQCAFCERKICANLTVQHPGWAQRLVSPEEALDLVRRQVSSHPGETFVVGVAGPGEPLANAETFEALERVHQQYPYLFKCLSTNGLLLEEKLPQLLKAGIRTLTVTVNAVDSSVGEQIYLWVRHQGEILRGQEGAELMITSQRRGIRAALDAGLVVKANTVLIPGVNDSHMATLAQHLKDLGVHLMNIMPLIPCGQMKDRRPPTPDEMRRARLACEGLMPQFRKCEQCSADVVRFPQIAPSLHTSSSARGQLPPQDDPSGS